MSANILYSCPDVDRDRAKAIAATVEKRYKVSVTGYPSTRDLLMALVAKNVTADYVAVDCNEFKDFVNDDLYSSITTVSTLSHVNNPNVKIIAVVDKDVDKSLLKLLIGFKEIDFFSVRSGGFTDDEVYKSVENFLTDGDRVPSLVKNILESRKKSGRKDIVLTPRQQQILDIIVTRGASNKIIAKMLAISESTVKLHVGCIFRKYGVKNRTQLAVFAKNTH